MVERILIAVDGSDFSKTALAYGIYIGKKLGARLIGLHVLDIKIIQGPLLNEIAFYSGLPAYYEFLPKIEEAMQKRAEKILGDFKGTCENAGVPFELRMAKGLIDEMIIAEGENADWTLLAQRGEHYHLSQGMLLGTTAEGVARKSTKPVLIAPRVFHEIESMGLAYDGSGPAQRALIMAGKLSEKTKWPLTVITITDDPGVADKLSSRIESTLEAFDIDFEGITLKGREDREILNFIRQGAVELMIMGAFGHRRIRELLLGSTTSHIIRNSTIPVLLTR